MNKFSIFLDHFETLDFLVICVILPSSPEKNGSDELNRMSVTCMYLFVYG